MRPDRPTTCCASDSRRTARSGSSASLNDLRSRFEKKREKLAWTTLKTALTDAGFGDKLYRSLKQSKVDAEVL